MELTIIYSFSKDYSEGLIFFKHLFLSIRWGTGSHACAVAHVCGGQRTTEVFSSLLPPRASQKSNSGYQPSCHLTGLGFNFYNLNSLKARSVGSE